MLALQYYTTGVSDKIVASVVVANVIAKVSQFQVPTLGLVILIFGPSKL